MKPQIAKELIKSIKERGWIEKDGVFYTPTQAAEMGITPVKAKKMRGKNLIKTGDIHDERNIRNKANQKDFFMKLMEIELQIDIWPEFYFTTKREFRFDYAIPEHKIGIEQNGGIWSKGNSGHSSGTGIQRDMDKSSLAASLGWRVISRSPEQMMTSETIELIKSALKIFN